MSSAGDSESDEQFNIIYVNHETVFRFTLKNPEIINASLYDITGSFKIKICSGLFVEGEHKLTLSEADFSAGVYFLVIQKGSQVFTKKVLIY